LPVNLHVTDPDGRKYPGRVETPLADFTRLAREFPTVTFILAHWGGLLPLRDASARELTNVFYDTAASPLLYDAGVWRRFIEAVGAERVLFGSDYPLNLYPKLEAGPEMKLLVAEAEAGGAGEAVLRGNATRLLKR
jgi:predicted TIM-barrel fold metal-dependent hydrolase